MANEQEERDPVEMTDDPTTTPARKPTAGRREEISDDPEAVRAELERTRKALSAANKEAADRRRRLEELEAADDERKRASLSEMDRLKQDRADAARKAAEAERKAQDAEEALVRLRVDMAVERAAAAMGFEYPDIAPSLIDRSRVSIDEETGKPTGIREALERLVKDKPGLAAAPPRGGTPPRDGPPRTRSGGRGQQPADVEAELRATRNYTF